MPPSPPNFACVQVATIPIVFFYSSCTSGMFYYGSGNDKNIGLYKKRVKTQKGDKQLLTKIQKSALLMKVDQGRKQLSSLHCFCWREKLEREKESNGGKSDKGSAGWKWGLLHCAGGSGCRALWKHVSHCDSSVTGCLQSRCTYPRQRTFSPSLVCHQRILFLPGIILLLRSNIIRYCNSNPKLIGTGTFGCASVIGEGQDFIAENVTFENSAPRGSGQAVALRVTADRCAFYSCRFLGWQV
ncbi:hypothetical protein Cgig2_023078 [Carnegiea gigantea]|uniref:pectinesterase n=1 Tax=Carnegiea gigantea TaxID=171969 RepID=A0A9Q1JYD3_9CARY|nr:hypothetical protein Cgig2_023078 [Carnegiea gigantea]